MPKKPTTKKPADKKPKAPKTAPVKESAEPAEKPAKACTCRVPGCM